MELATAIRAVLATLRRRPSDLLPLYLLIIAVPAITRVVTFAGMAALWAYLATTGRLDRFLDELSRVELAPPDPDAPPDEIVAWVDQFEPLIDILLTPTSLAILAVTILVTIVAAVVLAAGAEAAQMAGCYARLRKKRGLVAGIRGAREHWLAFLGLYLLELALWVFVTGLSVLVIGAAALASLAAAVLLGVFVLFAWLGAVIAIRAVFAFAPVAIVVEDVSVLASLRRSAAYIRGDLVGAVGYYAISVGVILGFLSFASVLGPFGGAALASIGGALLVTPGLHLLKTVLYGDHRGTVGPYTAPPESLRDQAMTGIRRGIREVRWFVRRQPVLHLLAAGTLIAGFAAGWALVGPIEGTVDASIRRRLGGIIPPIAALEFFGNNWAVAMAAAFSGIAMSVPSLVALFYNGIAFGIFTRLEVEPEVLIAFVAPHGILEIPAIVIAGAVGIQLGLSAWRTWRGGRTRIALADDLERAFWVLIGIGVLLAVAGFIEGFVSPFYFRLFL